MMERVARLRGKRPILIQVPFLTPRLSSLWLYLVTPASVAVARPLVESLRVPTVARDGSDLAPYRGAANELRRSDPAGAARAPLTTHTLVSALEGRDVRAQRRAFSNRGSSRTAAKSSSLRASSRNRGNSSTTVGDGRTCRRRCRPRALRSTRSCNAGPRGPACARGRRGPLRARRRTAARRRPSSTLCGTATPHPSRSPGTPRRVWRRQPGWFRPRSPSAATPARRTQCSWGRVDRLAVDLEGRLPIEHDVQLLLSRPGLVVLIDQRAVVARR